MKYEIERKFLLAKLPFRSDIFNEIVIMRSHYKNEQERITQYDFIRQNRTEWCKINKSKTKDSSVRKEKVKDLNVEDVRKFLSENKTTSIEKVRHITTDDNGVKWEIDEFVGLNLVVAECELLAHSGEQREELLQEQSTLDLPDFIERNMLLEVTDNEKFYNYNLSLLR